MRAIQISEFGGPEVLELADLPDPVATGDLLLLEVSSAGVNYADTHQAENSYLAPQRLPLVPGTEVVGRTADGRRVAALVAGGGYASKALAPRATTFELSDGVDDSAALALLVQGLTAWHLLRTSARMTPGESVVVHAAAGGVGSLAVQLAKTWGAGRVIASASSEDKRQLALDLGADVAVDANASDMRGALREANGGRKVDIVLEMTGGPVFDGSLAALAPFGRLAAYGQASRQQPTPVNPGELMARSQAVIGFWLVHCLARPEMVGPPMAELLSMVEAGTLRPVVGGSYPLSEAHRAHEDLRARRTTGKLTLDPTG
ncbi:MAG: zinc-binding dehydrogenase [Actinomycetota bacterium]|nr:zinc-binding dehydrogenase [Actinomycetota bacterium]